MTRVLAVADEEDESLLAGALARLRPDLLLSCGDLPFEYLESLISRTDLPLLYVPGNHDPDLRGGEPIPAWAAHDSRAHGPAGGENIDGRLTRAAGLLIGGLGGSVRYRPGPNQYTQSQMRFRAWGLELRARLNRRRIDVLLAHSPLFGFGDADDPAHRGFAALKTLVAALAPRVMIHGHVRRYGPQVPDLRIGQTLIVNAIPYRLLEL